MKMLMRVLLVFLLFAAGISPLYPQPVINVKKCDDTDRFPITPYTSLLRTRSLIGIDSVLKSVGQFVRSDNKPVLVYNYDPYYYWFRFVVRNAEPADRNLMLLMAPVGLYEGKLFHKLDGRWQQVAQTGLKYRFKDRSYQFTHHVFPFTILGQSIDTLYLSVDARNVYKSFGFALIQPKPLKIFENKIYFVFGIIVGLLLLFFVLNVSLFFALKEKLHLWYALYISLLFLIVMKNDHLDQQFLGLDSERAFRLTPYLSIGAFAIAILMHVVQRYFRQAIERHKFLYRLSLLVKINVLCSAVVHAVVFVWVTDVTLQSVVFNWGKYSTLLGIFIIMADCLYCVSKGYKSAWFILCGSFVFMVGSVQRLFFASTLSFLFPPTTFHIGIIVETFVISLGLIYRYWNEKEMHRFREEQIQLQTMNDISEEIHDNVGQVLTLANLQLRTYGLTTQQAIPEKITDAKTLISQAIVDLRNLSRTLKNESVPETGLVVQIQAQLKLVEKTDVLKTLLNVHGTEMQIGSKKQFIVIRIIQGVAQNVIKHANATTLEVSLNFKAHALHIDIRDNGIGFNISEDILKSNGLQNIQNRCLLLNATCHIESKPGQGTGISIIMPV